MKWVLWMKACFCVVFTAPLRPLCVGAANICLLAVSAAETPESRVLAEFSSEIASVSPQVATVGPITPVIELLRLH